MTAVAGSAALALSLTLGGCGGPVDDAAGEPRTPSALPSDNAQPGKSVGSPRVLAGGLEVPWAIDFLPDGNALVTERDSARLLRVTPQGKKSVVGKVPGVEPGGEGGLMGLAVSPTFDRDRYVYLYFTAPDDNRVVRFKYSGRGVGRLEPLVTGIPKAGIHNGGRLAFGPDGMLYASTGESGDPPLSQVKKSLGGKILRLRPDGSPAPGNPFGNRVWSYGHRNVQGLAWDGDKRMYASEFGQDTFDEVNRIRAGRNYGWPEVEGVGKKRDFVNPELTWQTSEASPSGLAYADGSLWVGALRGERLWQVPLSKTGETGRPQAHFTGKYGRLRAVVRAPDGALWVATSNRDGRGDPARDDDRILVLPLS
jgi:glucose/arabinose dehydrogenase